MKSHTLSHTEKQHLSLFHLHPYPLLTMLSPSLLPAWSAVCRTNSHFYLPLQLMGPMKNFLAGYHLNNLLYPVPESTTVTLRSDWHTGPGGRRWDYILTLSSGAWLYPFSELTPQAALKVFLLFPSPHTLSFPCPWTGSATIIREKYHQHQSDLSREKFLILQAQLLP